MRIGRNPAKEAPQLGGYGRHRVIIPVFIPNEEGYFARSLEVLQICLESLRLTAGGKAAVTVISNAAAPTVVAELDRQFREGWIDQVVLNRENRGKIDAVVSEARGCFEELITVSDCDVLFKPGWLEVVEQIFADFPECGFASPAPSPVVARWFTSATILGGMARRELGYEKVVPEEDLDRFARSIGNPDLYSAEDRKSQLVVRRNGAMACVGCQHWVCTFRREVIRGMPAQPSQQAIEGKSEHNWLDIPPDKLGFWRLAAPRAYAYHVGNVPDQWSLDELDRYRQDSRSPFGRPERLPAARRDWPGVIPWRVRNRLVKSVARSRAFPARTVPAV